MTEHSDRLARLLAESERYAAKFEDGHLSAPPLAGLAIVTCMDARMVVEDIFGLRAGDANLIRNAGAVASDDAIRSLLLSRHVLGTSEIVVLGHTGCGMYGLDDEALRTRLERDSGASTSVQFGSFSDLDDHVLRQVVRIAGHPWLAGIPVHGLIYEVESGRVRALARA